MSITQRSGGRWSILYYGPELEQRLRRHLKPTNKSWRVERNFAPEHLRSLFLLIRSAVCLTAK
jgi:hypothetical protein